jgi:hypothetical protein
MGISVSGTFTQQMRQLDNYIGTAASHVRQGSLDHPMFENLDQYAAVARELAPRAAESRHFARVQGALSEAAKDTTRSKAFSHAILEARREMNRGIASVGAKPHLAQHQTSAGAAAIEPAAHSPHFGVDDLDHLGNAYPSTRGHVGNDGASYTSAGEAYGARSHDDFSDVVLF